MNEKPSRWDVLKGALSGRKPGEPAPPAAVPPTPSTPTPPAAPTPAGAPFSPVPPLPESLTTTGIHRALHPRDDQTRLAALYRVTRTLGTSLEVDEVLAQVIDAVIDLTGAERGLLVLAETDPSDWTLRIARNFDQEKLADWEREVSSTIIRTAIDTRTSIVTADALNDPRFSTSQSVIFNALRSMMCAPLLARGRLIGAIYVDSRIQRGIFDEADLQMLDAFATQASFAIDNARIYTQVAQQVHKLTIELDEVKRDKAVAEITESEYFIKLQAKVKSIKDARKGTPPRE